MRKKKDRSGQPSSGVKGFFDRTHFKRKYLVPYEKLLERVRPKLDLNGPIRVKLASGWYFQIPSERRGYTLFCPPYTKRFEPAFVHYLAHAKLLEDGWRRPQINVFRKKSKFLFGWINRSADSFFDFYVWNLVTEKLGKRYFLRFTKSIIEHKPQQVIQAFRYFYKKQRSKFTAYTVCLDWFAMFYVLSRQIDKGRHRQLGNLFDQLILRKEFKRFVPARIKSRITRIKRFYSLLIKKYPTYLEFIKDGDTAQKEYIRYYAMVWQGTGLKVKITEFV